MGFENKRVIITGAAGGIGEALARAFHEAGARLVLGDLDMVRLQPLASELGAIALQTDVSTEAGILKLVAQTRESYGGVDIFCSNAGILRGHHLELLKGGPFTPDKDWDQSWKVNVMAHVWAARAVLPEMVERGDGALIHIASAAGLLTEMGSQSYSVTKHAAVGFSEWLALHYAPAGIRVVCVCPQGVRTPMVTEFVEGHEHLSQNLLEPEDVARSTLQGLENNQFLVLPHPEVARYFQNKARGYETWLAGMRKLKQKLWGNNLSDK
jgi:NAD(P)-dependent dehydrogenase (short-subunit alcohol dehydrogenase family)